MNNAVIITAGNTTGLNFVQIAAQGWRYEE